MGVLRFQLPSPPSAERLAELRRCYVTGLDRIPERVSVEVRGDLMTIRRDRIESVRMHAPWPVEGFGMPMVATATLVERPTPYALDVEMARGKLNDVLNQAADWRHLGLAVPTSLEDDLRAARRAFATAATRRDDRETATKAANESLVAAHRASRALVREYTQQVLARRLEHVPKLPAHLAARFDGSARQAPWGDQIAETVNAARVSCSWRSIAPEEGRLQYDEFEATVQWARKRRLAVQAGPLIELRPSAIPDWLWLWEGDYESIAAMASEFVRNVITRQRGKVQTWVVVGRPCSHEILGLSEEEQFRLTARLVQVARGVDPDAQIVVDLDRPWADWMASSFFQIGPLHLADHLVRAEVGLTGLGLEIAPGFHGVGSPMHDLLDFSRILDLFSLLNLPLHVSMALPASADPDPRADTGATVEAGQWPGLPSEAMQLEWARDWASLALAKPFVRSLTWLTATDASPHVFPNTGLHRADQTPRPLVGWLKEFRRQYLP